MGLLYVVCIDLTYRSYIYHSKSRRAYRFQCAHTHLPLERQYRRGGRATQHLLSWTGLGGKKAGGEGEGRGLLMIAGGGAAGKGAGADAHAVATRGGEGTSVCIIIRMCVTLV